MRPPPSYIAAPTRGCWPGVVLIWWLTLATGFSTRRSPLSLIDSISCFSPNQAMPLMRLPCKLIVNPTVTRAAYEVRLPERTGRLCDQPLASGEQIGQLHREAMALGACGDVIDLGPFQQDGPDFGDDVDLDAFVGA